MTSDGFVADLSLKLCGTWEWFLEKLSVLSDQCKRHKLKKLLGQLIWQGSLKNGRAAWQGNGRMSCWHPVLAIHVFDYTVFLVWCIPVDVAIFATTGEQHCQLASTKGCVCPWTPAFPKTHFFHDLLREPPAVSLLLCHVASVGRECCNELQT